MAVHQTSETHSIASVQSCLISAEVSQCIVILSFLFFLFLIRLPLKGFIEKLNKKSASDFNLTLTPPLFPGLGCQGIQEG